MGHKENNLKLMKDIRALYDQMIFEDDTDHDAVFINYIQNTPKSQKGHLQVFFAGCPCNFSPILITNCIKYPTVAPYIIEALEDCVSAVNKQSRMGQKKWGEDIHPN